MVLFLKRCLLTLGFAVLVVGILSFVHLSKEDSFIGYYFYMDMNVRNGG